MALGGVWSSSFDRCTDRIIGDRSRLAAASFAPIVPWLLPPAGPAAVPAASDAAECAVLAARSFPYLQSRPYSSAKEIHR